VRGRLICGVAALVLLGTASVASAATPVGCSDLPALFGSGPGEAVAGGVYQLPATTCMVNLNATNQAAFTLEGASGGGTVLEPATASSPIISSHASVRFTLSGMTFTGTNGASAVALPGNGSGVTILGNTFTNDVTSSGVGAGVEISGTSAQPTVVSENIFSHDSAGFGGGGLYFDTGAPITIDGNTFTADSQSTPTSGIGGGALLLADFEADTNPVSVTDNVFGGSSQAQGDTAAGSGGAAYVLLYGPTEKVLTLSGNTFENDRITGVKTASNPRDGGGLAIAIGYGGSTYDVVQSENSFSGNVIDETQAAPSPLQPAGGAGEWVSGVSVQSTDDRFIANRVEVNDGQPPEGGALGAIATAAALSVPAEPAMFVGRDDLFSGNSTAPGGWGGAIYVGGPAPDCTGPCPGSSVTLDDSTVVANSVDAGAGSEGGAIWGSPNDSLAIANSIVFGNTPQPELFGFGSTAPGFSFSDVCNEAGGPAVVGTGVICTDPMLNADGTETAASPTLDAGSNALIPTGLVTDLAGLPRVTAYRVTCSGPGPAVVDMGAFEAAQGPVPSCPPPNLLTSAPTVGTTAAGASRSATHAVTVVLTCVGTASQTCAGHAALSTLEHQLGSRIVSVSTAGKRKRTKKVTVGIASFALRGGQSVKLTVPLNAKGRALLRRFHKLPVSLLVTVTGADGDPATLAMRKLTIKQPAKRKRH
jgi:hypothetical protein